MKMLRILGTILLLIPVGLWAQSVSTHYSSVDPGSFTSGGYNSKMYSQNFIVNTWYCAPLQSSVVYAGQSGMPSGFIFGDSTIAAAPDTVVMDSLVCVSDTSWRKSTVRTSYGANLYPWPGVDSLPHDSTFTLPAIAGQPYGYKTIEAVMGTEVIKTDSSVTYFRKTFELGNDTGVMARFRSYMDDGMEIYLNGKLVAREDDRTPANYKGVSHDLVLNTDGSADNGFMGGDVFDVVTTLYLDSLVHTGTNVLILAIRNKSSGDLGGFSFRMDLKSGLSQPPVLVDSCVSDAGWQKSTFTTSTTANSYPWPGAPLLPADSTFTLPVTLGQPYGYKSIDVVAGSSVIKATENITYYRKPFDLSDSSAVNLRIRAAFDDNMEVYLNRKLLLREADFGAANRLSPFHDVRFLAGGTSANGFMGGDPWDFVATADLDTCLKKGENNIIVAIRNRTSDLGGFSLRIDMDKGGSPVIVRKTEEQWEVSPPSGELLVYPNPAYTSVHINIPIHCEPAKGELILADASGKIIYRQYAAESIEIDLRYTPPGVYLVRLYAPCGTFTKRLIKQ